LKRPVKLNEVFFVKGKTLFPIKGQSKLFSFLAAEKAMSASRSKSKVKTLKPALVKKKK
tara:strand:+ start:1347 stop:1523 length:177 start_codon:yes stop_codon:yes gene_type:complete